MCRPCRTLEIGAGATTLFLLQAAAENIFESEIDRNIAFGKYDHETRLALLRKAEVAIPYSPTVISLDKLPENHPKIEPLLKIARKREWSNILNYRSLDFRGAATRLLSPGEAVDFLWFDCGGPRYYIDFLREYWPLLNENDGILG